MYMYARTAKRTAKQQYVCPVWGSETFCLSSKQFPLIYQAASHLQHTNRHIKRSVYCQYGLGFLSDEGPMLETLDHTIRIGSTPTFLYFHLYLYSAYAAHYVYLHTYIYIR